MNSAHNNNTVAISKQLYFTFKRNLSRMKALLSLAALVTPVLCLSVPYVSASSSPSVARQSLKPKRLRNETAKPFQPNESSELFDPYIGLVEVENLNVERKQQVLDVQIMSMMIVEPMPSSRPTYSLEQASPPSFEPTLTPAPTQSPTIDDPNFGKVEGKARNSAAGRSQLIVPSLVFAVLLSSCFWY